MVTPRELLVLLFAMFWASILSTAARYHGFPTASLWADREGTRQKLLRLAMSTGLLNLLPIVLLWFLWQWTILPDDRWGALPDNWRKFLGLGAATMAALTVFGVIRIYHACVASSGTLGIFYSPDELKRFGTTIQGSDEPQRSFLAHFVPGIAYLAIWGGLAYGIRLIIE